MTALHARSFIVEVGLYTSIGVALRGQYVLDAQQPVGYQYKSRNLLSLFGSLRFTVCALLNRGLF